MDPIYVTGHRNPDTDSIVAAMAYAALRNALGDREYEAALSATDDSTRNRHWRRCQEILREDCPWVFAHHNKASSLVRARVKNYIPSDFPYGSERFYKVGSDK